nr:hypothetical protein [uncultured Anaerocolumna sp.]
MFGKKKAEKVVLGNLIEGLPIPQNAEMTVRLTPDGVSITVPGTQQTFEINISKLLSIQYFNETELEKVISQSAPGMVIGAVAFGVLGAMVGGRVKTKEERIVRHFIIINYDDKQIIVETTKDWYNGAALVDYFKKLKPSSVQPTVVEL